MYDNSLSLVKGTFSAAVLGESLVYENLALFIDRKGKGFTLKVGHKNYSSTIYLKCNAEVNIDL